MTYYSGNFQGKRNNTIHVFDQVFEDDNIEDFNVNNRTNNRGNGNYESKYWGGCVGFAGVIFLSLCV